MLGPIDQLIPPAALANIRKTIGPVYEFAANVQVMVLNEKQDMSGKVAVLVPHDIPLALLLVIAEYLSHLVAQKSDAGYEKALDLIREGAMGYKTEVSGA